MDVGGFFNALASSGGVKIDIRLNPPPPGTGGVVPMDHYPSWKLHKNPFWRVKHPASIGMRPAAPSPNGPVPGGPGGPMGSTETAVAPVLAFEASQDVGGVVTLQLAPGKKVEHLGIKVQFIGRIDMGIGSQDGRPHYDFVSLSKELSPPGVLYQNITEFPFLFRNMDKEHESYRGRNVSVRYFVQVILDRKFLPPMHKEHDVWVQSLGTPPTQNDAIKMEVGIEDCLHIEFEYQRKQYHLQDTILGRIHFLLVRIKIKHMELAVIRRETSGDAIPANAGATNNNSHSDANVLTETQTLVKYEIMDGAPVKGEVIPVKLSLRGVPADLTPTYTAIHNRFSVRYFLNLVLVDEEDRRYFKQQEIVLWRKELG